MLYTIPKIFYSCRETSISCGWLQSWGKGYIYTGLRAGIMSQVKISCSAAFNNQFSIENLTEEEEEEIFVFFINILFEKIVKHFEICTCKIFASLVLNRLLCFFFRNSLLLCYIYTTNKICGEKILFSHWLQERT